MTRITINPVFDIETGKLIGHDGQYETDHVPIRCDRGATAQAKQQGQAAGSVAAGSGANATADRAAVIPGLVSDASHPQGYSPVDLNNQRVAAEGSLGGATSGITGQANLMAARTRNSGGFAPALAEAQREKGRQLAGANLSIANNNADLKQRQQLQARQQLLGLYGTDTSNQLHGMGLQGEDLQSQLAAGRQGWLQNTEGVLGTIGNLGASAAGVKKSFG